MSFGAAGTSTFIVPVDIWKYAYTECPSDRGKISGRRVFLVRSEIESQSWSPFQFEPPFHLTNRITIMVPIPTWTSVPFRQLYHNHGPYSNDQSSLHLCTRIIIIVLIPRWTRAPLAFRWFSRVVIISLLGSIVRSCSIIPVGSQSLSTC